MISVRVFFLHPPPNIAGGRERERAWKWVGLGSSSSYRLKWPFLPPSSFHPGRVGKEKQEGKHKGVRREEKERRKKDPLGGRKRRRRRRKRKTLLSSFLFRSFWCDEQEMRIYAVLARERERRKKRSWKLAKDREARPNFLLSRWGGRGG